MRNPLTWLLATLFLFSLANLALAKADDDVEALIKQLQDKDAVVRLKAAKSLGSLGGKAKDALPALTEALKDKDPDVRAVARNAIDSIKAAPEKGNPKLEEIAKDLRGKNAAARLKAATKLGEMGEAGKPIASALVEAMLDTYPRNRDKYFEALEKVDPESQKLILVLLTENQPEKKLEAIDGMENLGEDGKACIPVLVKFFYLDKSGKLSRDLSFASKIVPVLVKINPDDKAVAQAVLAAVSTQNRLPIDSGLRAKAIEAARDLKTDPKVVAKALISALMDPMCRLAAVEALGSLGKDAREAVPVLTKLKFDMNKDVREAAITALDAIKE
jgi:HEAT repeat protein